MGSGGREYREGGQKKVPSQKLAQDSKSQQEKSKRLCEIFVILTLLAAVLANLLINKLKSEKEDLKSKNEDLRLELDAYKSAKNIKPHVGEYLQSTDNDINHENV